ncbi:MAG: tRNA pseudouridine(55) synthase TruB [Erysipelotrichaceae bacterium]|nr:tRNA pseudouridine(55) synthase TruB [Erysipelotrichaceae bacterium]
MDGILYINKPKDWTSFDVVAKLRRVLHTKSIGHTGTLDPQATGVLVLLVGKATKILPYLEKSRKEYIAEIEFGKKTDTGDIWGNVIETGEIKDINETTLIDALNSFLGHSMQKPPMVSAIKKDGKKLYEYARAGIEIEVEKRPIEIFEIELLNLNPVRFRVVCSAGTYVRSLCEDIAEKLGMLGTMSSLVRTKVENISLDECVDLMDVSEDTPLHEVEKVLSGVMELHEISDAMMVHAKNGKKLFIDRNEELLCLTHQHKALAIVYKDHEENVYRIKRGLWG